MLTEAEKMSPLGQKLLREFQAREQRLLKLCGNSLDADPQRDAQQTARLRGRIAEVRAFLKEFEAGATAPVESGDESPQM